MESIFFKILTLRTGIDVVLGIRLDGMPKSSLALMNALLMYKFTEIKKKWIIEQKLLKITYFFARFPRLNCAIGQTDPRSQCKPNSTFFRICSKFDSFWCWPHDACHRILPHKSSKIPSTAQILTAYFGLNQAKFGVGFASHHRTKHSIHQRFLHLKWRKCCNWAKWTWKGLKWPEMGSNWPTSATYIRMNISLLYYLCVVWISARFIFVAYR